MLQMSRPAKGELPRGEKIEELSVHGKPPTPQLSTPSLCCQVSAKNLSRVYCHNIEYHWTAGTGQVH